MTHDLRILCGVFFMRKVSYALLFQTHLETKISTVIMEVTIFL